LDRKVYVIYGLGSWTESVWESPLHITDVECWYGYTFPWKKLQSSVDDTSPSPTVALKVGSIISFYVPCLSVTSPCY